MNILIILCTCFGLTMKEEEREMIWDNNKKITYRAMALVACPKGPACMLLRPWQFPWVSNQDHHGGRGLEKVAPRKETIF